MPEQSLPEQGSTRFRRVLVKLSGEALAAPDREQAIDAADADIQRFADGMALERVDHRTIHRHPVLGAHAALAIQGAPSAIEHTTEHGHAHGQASGVDQRHDPRPWRDTGQAADRHEE